jgi:YebC/PmpR family DNA-binding regulatory protein
MMAGHSKWANIQHRKNLQDAKRGHLFTKLIRAVTVAARSNPDPASNAHLRLAIHKAFAANVSRETVNKAIKRGTGELVGNALEEIRYEGYGPSGMAVMLEVLTDNRNRTAAEVRHTFNKHGGKLGTEGSVAWMFHRKGIISLQKTLTEADLMELALAVGAEDILQTERCGYLLTNPDALETICATLKAQDLAVDQADVLYLPIQLTLLTDPIVQAPVKDLLNALEALDDMQNVYAACGWPIFLRDNS